MEQFAVRCFITCMLISAACMALLFVRLVLEVWGF